MLNEDAIGLDLIGVFKGFNNTYMTIGENGAIVESYFRILSISEKIRRFGLQILRVSIDKIRRVAAQQGLFVGLEYSSQLSEKLLLTQNFVIRYLLDFLSFKWAYVRTDERFEIKSLGISSDVLFPSDGGEFQDVEFEIALELERIRGAS